MNFLVIWKNIWGLMGLRFITKSWTTKSTNIFKKITKQLHILTQKWEDKTCSSSFNKVSKVETVWTCAEEGRWTCWIKDKRCWGGREEEDQSDSWTKRGRMSRRRRSLLEIKHSQKKYGLTHLKLNAKWSWTVATN